MNQQSEPQFQCRGIWIPADLEQLFMDEVINLKEAYLAAVIDTLVKCRGEGCWASNQFLAGKVKVESRQITNLLTHLKSLGIVKENHKNGKRFLETTWSRSLGEKTPLEKNCDLASQKIASSASQKIAPRGVRESESNPNEHPARRVAAAGSEFSRQEKSKTSAHVHNQDGLGLDRSKKDFTTVDLLDARKLYNSLKLAGLLYKNNIVMADWAVEFAKLRKSVDDPDTIRPVLDWYCDNLKERYTPQALTAATFAKKFDQIVAAMNRPESMSKEELGY